MSADMLTDMVDLLIIMLTNIDQDLVNILTDSEQTYRPMGAFSTQLRYKKFMIKCIVCLSSTLIYLYGHICIHLIEV